VRYFLDEVRVQTIPYDPMLGLTDAESQAVLLNDALATGDARVVVNVVDMIAEVRGVAGLGNDPEPRLGALLAALDGLGLGLRAMVLPPIAGR
jgi:DNA-binding phage protein